MGKLPEQCLCQGSGLYIMGMIGSSGADYLSVEYHGEGVKTLSVADRMTIANLASEMGAKNAVFPADEVLLALPREEDTTGYGLIRMQAI